MKYWLHLFYKEEDHKTSSAIHHLTTSVFRANSGSLGLLIYEWKSVNAFKPKIQYHINVPGQCALTDSSGGFIVRLTVPQGLADLAVVLRQLGYKSISEKLLVGRNHEG